MLVKESPPVIVCGAPARIGPHRLEIDLPLQLGNGPSAAQNGDAFSPLPRAM
jgi:hypothetical protein